MPTRLSELRTVLVRIADGSSGLPGRTYATVNLVLIYLTVLTLVVPALFPIYSRDHAPLLELVELVVLVAFSADLAMRLVLYQNRLRYVFSYFGMVDILSVAPSLVALALGSPIEGTWLRVLRIFRFARVFRASRSKHVMPSLLGQLVPYAMGAVAFKGLVLVLEAEGWWPRSGDLGIVVGVTGFALAILLGTKLSIINARLYAIEDAVCRIVGALRELRTHQAVAKDVIAWADRLRRLLSSPNKSDIAVFRSETDLLAEALTKVKLAGPNIAAFHRDVAYVLHRSTARMPETYERFLRRVTVAYVGVVILAVPGVTGFVATILIVYVLGGAYLLIEDMDRPFSFSPDSCVDVDLAPLSEFVDRYSVKPSTRAEAVST